MKQETLPLGTSLSRADMKNIKGGWLPEYTLWTCSNYAYPYKVVGSELTNPATDCPGVGTCTVLGTTQDYDEVCEVVDPY